MYYENTDEAVWNDAKGVFEYTANTDKPIGVKSYTYLGGKFLGEDVKSVLMKFDYESGTLKRIEYYFDSGDMEKIKGKITEKYGEGNRVLINSETYEYDDVKRSWHIEDDLNISLDSDMVSIYIN